MDWKDTLGALLASGTLPEGEEIKDEKTEEQVRPRKKDTLHVFIERKGRKGKTATIITGFTGDDDELQALAKNLKQRLGVGGSCGGGEILIQGDCREKACGYLNELGYKTK